MAAGHLNNAWPFMSFPVIGHIVARRGLPHLLHSTRRLTRNKVTRRALSELSKG
jgi:hypothetical protein